MRLHRGAWFFVVSLGLLGCQVTIGDGQGQGGVGGADPGGWNNPGQGGSPGGTSPEDPARRSAINELVAGSGKMATQPAQLQQIPCDGCPPDGQEGTQFCTYKRYNETRVFDDLVAFAPNSATLWPGSVVVGQDAKQGLLTPVGVELAPVTFSVSLENLAGSPTGKMTSPSLSSFREQMLEILKGASQAKAPARLDYQEEVVQSEQQLGLQLGFGVGYKGFGVQGAFNFSSGSSRTRIVARFTQTYYTVDVDTPKSPADFFGPGVTAAQLSSFVGSNNPPLYVQSISYGRQGFFFLETEATVSEIQTSLKAAFNAVLAKAETSLETTHKDRLDSSTMKVVILGGSGTSAVQSINGYQGFLKTIQEGAEYSPDSPGVPIAYKLAYLDNAVASFHLTSEYTAKECFKNKVKLTGKLAKIVPVTTDGSGASEYFGDIGIFYPKGGNGGCNDQTSGYLPLMSYGPGQWWSPSGSYTKSVENVPFGPGKKLCIYVDLTEEDTFFNDYFKTAYKEVPLASGQHQISVAGSEEQAEVVVQITVELGEPEVAPVCYPERP